HKRAHDGDTGLNTGGMGTVAPNPYYTEKVANECMEKIFVPTISAMKKEGRTFKGCLYFGLMITKDGPKVIEYNCRFGDPETQVVLPLLKSDLLDIMISVSDGTLSECAVEFEDAYSCCVVKASDGYPEKYQSGYKITQSGEVSGDIFYAGAKLDENGDLITSGGRVLGVTAKGKTLKEAIDSAYKDAESVTFENEYMRHDIGARALAAEV
ncbi:MAG: phosphoribosylamine--glycine ligase, partial [Firmicutes bacterium]|nr:phosphoribosylamine--glycine ligase [Bacillota bacterium]